MKQRFSLKQYLHEAATKIRQLESERIRDDLSALERLDETTDETLLRKWGWISTIAGTLFAFLIMPFVIAIVQPFVPAFIDQLLWAITKVSMGMSLLMFAASVYFTVGFNSDR